MNGSFVVTALCTALGITALCMAGMAEGRASEPPAEHRLDGAERDLWRSAWTWEARGRGDLARAALEKLLRARPRDVELMLDIALIELRANRVDAAREMRERMQRVAPGHRALDELDTAIRVLGRERIRLASVRRLQELSRHEEALAELRSLFPDGPPRHTLGLEYWRIVADMPDGWAAARDGFAALVDAHPTDPRYELALAEHLTAQAPTRPQGLRRLLALDAREDLRRDALVAAWRRALQRADADEVTPQMLQHYAALVPDDPEARAWAQAGRLPRRTVTAASPVPDDPALVRGRSLLEQGATDHALAYFERAAGRDASSVDAARGRVQALIALGRADEAVSVADALRAADPATRRARAGLRAEALAARARARLDRGERSLALRDFETALALQPDDPWLRYDLAREYAALGVPEEGEALMREALGKGADSVDARFALALYLENIDREREVIEVLAAVPSARRTDGMRALEARARLRVARETAAREAAEGRIDAARRTLAAAEALATDAAAVESLARSWIDLGDVPRARRLVEERLARQPGDPDLQLARLRVLEASADEGAYADALRTLQDRADWSEDEARELDARAHALDLQRIAALRRSGDAAAALVLADERLARTAEATAQEALLRERAAALVLLGRPDLAASAYATLIERAPDDPALHLDHADALAAAGQAQAARAAVRAALARTRDEDVDLRLSVARRLRASGDRDEAAALLAVLRTQAPHDAGVLEESGWLSRASGDDAAARRYFAAAQRQAPDKPALAEALEAIDARRQGWISAGVDIESKPGAPGISDVLTLQVPVEWRWPQAGGGHWFGQVDRVHLDVGRLPADYDEAALYGTVQARGPEALDGFADGYTPRAQGTALGIGYENARVRVDIGSTPIGFDEEDVVGGLRVFARSGAIDWTFDVSRRPVTSSLVSYAGARDPASDRIWGGVRRNGVSGRAAYYGARHSASLTLDAARFDGREVPDNDYFGARAAYDWRVFDRSGDRLFVGVSASYWNYRRNQRFYTYGHGGYYSPQSYLNVALPLQWLGARGRWTYELFASISHSDSDERSVPFYPTDPALQAQALASPLPAGFDAPVYEGGGGSGTGHSLRAALEYRLAPLWALGARAALDRSDYYEPDFFALYLRRVFSEPGGVLREPPRPPRRYGDY
ncbi:MAG: cellulose synthase subunit BcsC-related outer membrane protein [Sinimarinibacterium flocculans]|uniref:cellulose biosynthesis protein BcsC n=1 Tax=Sinimarinibacterium flocculans TaxID=985250 RepID=UPI003C453D9F